MSKKARSDYKRSAARGQATTFRPEEIAAFDELATKLLAGGDVRVIARSQHFRSVVAKFRRMSLSLEEGGAA